MKNCENCGNPIDHTTPEGVDVCEYCDNYAEIELARMEAEYEADNADWY